jgi:hypothetical protein
MNTEALTFDLDQTNIRVDAGGIPLNHVLETFLRFLHGGMVGIFIGHLEDLTICAQG